MKCFACDCTVSSESYDSKTDRFYCLTCMEPTNEIILNQELRDATKDHGLEMADRVTDLVEFVPFPEEVLVLPEESPWDE